MKTSIICLILLLCMANVYAQQIQLTNASGQNSDILPEAGNTIHYTYNATGTKLEGESEIEASLYYVKDKHPVATDLIAVKNGEVWNTSFKLPDSALAFAVRFRSGKVIDNNDGAGYIYHVYKGDRPLKGSCIAKALIYQYCQRSLDLSSRNRLVALDLCEKEFLLHPDLKPLYEQEYFRILAAVKKKESYPVIEKHVHQLLNDNSFSEEKWQQASRLYELIGQRVKSDSLRKIMAARAPYGQMAQSLEWNRFQALNDADSMLAFYYSYSKRFRGKSGSEGAYMLLFLIDRYVKEGRYEEALKHLPLLSDKQMGADIYNDIASGLAGKRKNLELADSLSRLAIAIKKQEVEGPGTVTASSIPPAEWRDINNEKYGEYLATYAFVMAAKKDIHKALHYQEKAVHVLKGEKAAVNEDYVLYLLQCGDSLKARLMGEKFVRTGYATSNIKKYLKETYKPSGLFNAYIDSLEADINAKIRRVLLKDLVSKKINDFVLPSLEGGNVALSEMKGKVIIVDFWATWCTPCKASFPGMQNVVSKYKDNKDVVFLFIDTWENVSGDERKNLLKKFLKDHNYSFQVVLDQPLAGGSRSYRLAKDFEVEGIPTKFILDRHGNIRFVSIGFKGDTQQLETELSNMIEITKGL